MDLIKTGRGLSQTIRNASRLREIVLVFARNGFDEFISQGVVSAIPHFVLPKLRKNLKSELAQKSEADWGQILGHRLRLCLEELGPTFIKFGQLLSSREDLFDQGFIKEMKVLRDKIRSVPFSRVRPHVEKSLGDKKIEEVFSHIEEESIGMASIGIVYKGVLKSGEEVVLKVRRPDIKKQIEIDFSLLEFLATQVEKVSQEAKALGVMRIINDFSLSLNNELNFHCEALNAKKFGYLIEKYEASDFYIPKFYSELSKEDLLVMEYLQGVSFNDVQGLRPRLEELRPKLNEGLKIFIRAFLEEGYYHADLHGGNFFLLQDDRFGLIDFGLMGTLSRHGRKSFIALIYAMLNSNYENLVFEFLDVAEYETIPDVDLLISDIREVLSPLVGLTALQTDFKLFTGAIFKVLRKHQIFLPREWLNFLRGLVTLDGIGRSFDLDFDLYSALEEDIYDILKSSFKKEDLVEEGVWAARDFMSLGRMMPRYLKWFLKDWSKRGHAHELILKGYDRPLERINYSLIFLGFCFLTSVFMIAGVLFIPSAGVEELREIPSISWIFWIVGIGLFMRGFWSIRR